MPIAEWLAERGKSIRQGMAPAEATQRATQQQRWQPNGLEYNDPYWQPPPGYAGYTPPPGLDLDDPYLQPPPPPVPPLAPVGLPPGTPGGPPEDPNRNDRLVIEDFGGTTTEQEIYGRPTSTPRPPLPPTPSVPGPTGSGVTTEQEVYQTGGSTPVAPVYPATTPVAPAPPVAPVVPGLPPVAPPPVAPPPVAPPATEHPNAQLTAEQIEKFRVEGGFDYISPPATEHPNAQLTAEQIEKARIEGAFDYIGGPGGGPPEVPPSSLPAAATSTTSTSRPAAPAAPATPPPPGSTPQAQPDAWAQYFAHLQATADEQRKQEATRLQLEQAHRDAQLAQNQARLQTESLVALSNPRTNYFSQFAFAEPNAEIPLTPQLAALARGQDVPTYGNVPGQIPTIPNDPARIQDVFRDIVGNLTTDSIVDLSPAGLDRLGVLGTVGGVNPTEFFQRRQAAIPRKSTLLGSSFL